MIQCFFRNIVSYGIVSQHSIASWFTYLRNMECVLMFFDQVKICFYRCSDRHVVALVCIANACDSLRLLVSAVKTQNKRGLSFVHVFFRSRQNDRFWWYMETPSWSSAQTSQTLVGRGPRLCLVLAVNVVFRRWNFRINFWEVRVLTGRRLHVINQ